MNRIQFRSFSDFFQRLQKMCGIFGVSLSIQGDEPRQNALLVADRSTSQLPDYNVLKYLRR